MNENLNEFAVIGELVKTLPEKVLQRFANTACSTFEQLILPVTATTSGFGRLLKAKFDGMATIEQYLTIVAIRKAEQKLLENDIKPVKIKDPATYLEAMNGVSKGTNKELHELWINLLANEMSTGSIHPVIPGILSRIDSSDAILLNDIFIKTEGTHKNITIKIAQNNKRIKPFFSVPKPPTSINHSILESLGLIKIQESEVKPEWKLTDLGKAFITAVSEPCKPTEGKKT